MATIDPKFFVLDDAAPRTPETAEALTADLSAWRVPCLVYSRIVGYLTPVQQWNAGKRREFADRTVFDREIALDDRP